MQHNTSDEPIKTSSQYLAEAHEWIKFLPIEIWRQIASYTPIYLDGVDIFSVLWPELDRKRLWIGKTNICHCVHYNIRKFKECNASDHIPMPVGKRLSRSICAGLNSSKVGGGHKIWTTKPAHKFSYVTCECVSSILCNNIKTCNKKTMHNCVCHRRNTLSCKAEKHKCICMSSINNGDRCRASHHKCYCCVVAIRDIMAIHNGIYVPSNEEVKQYIIDKQYITNCRYDGSHPDCEYDLDNNIDYAIVLLHHYRNYNIK